MLEFQEYMFGLLCFQCNSVEFLKTCADNQEREDKSEPNQIKSWIEWNTPRALELQAPFPQERSGEERRGGEKGGKRG